LLFKLHFEKENFKGHARKRKKIMVKEVEIVKGYFKIIVKVFFSCKWIGEE
jgi:hypothetical protein